MCSIPAALAIKVKLTMNEDEWKFICFHLISFYIDFSGDPPNLLIITFCHFLITLHDIFRACASFVQVLGKWNKGAPFISFFGNTHIFHSFYFPLGSMEIQPILAVSCGLFIGHLVDHCGKQDAGTLWSNLAGFSCDHYWGFCTFMENNFVCRFVSCLSHAQANVQGGLESSIIRVQCNTK